MVDIQTLQKEYAGALETTGFAEHSRFIKTLLSSDDDEMVAFHYGLIQNQDNWKLYVRLRSAFKKRGKVAEQFLLEAIKTEKNTVLQGDILHILGELDSAAALPIARRFMTHKAPEHREIACYVIGWLGGEQDIDSLKTAIDPGR